MAPRSTLRKAVQSYVSTFGNKLNSSKKRQSVRDYGCVLCYGEVFVNTNCSPNLRTQNFGAIFKNCGSVFDLTAG